MPVLAIWAVIQRIAGSALSFLGKLNIWQIGCIALALFAGVQTLRLHSEQRHSAKVEQQLTKVTGEIKRLAGQSKVQQRQATKTIDHYITVTKPEVHTQVEKIKSAPLPGNCKTPQAVMGADV